MGNFLGKERVVERISDQPKAQKRIFEVESAGKTFEFVEFIAREPSDTLLLRLPAIGINAEEEAEGVHYSMEQKYNTLTLKEYGDEYSHDALKHAVEKAIRASGKRHAILHGTSFGAGVIYDLMSDPGDTDFAKSNNIKGAILETPALGKNAFNKRFRTVSDSILIASGVKISRMVSASGAGTGTVGYRKPGQELKPNIMAELFRQKTDGRKLHIPLHVVFAEDDHLIDNAKTLEILKSQCTDLSFETVPSTAKSLRHQIDYGRVWKKERAVIDRFILGAADPS